MGKCKLCGGDTSWVGVCKNCGLLNNSSKKGKDKFELVFRKEDGEVKLYFPLEENLSLEEFMEKNKDIILTNLDEGSMASIGYTKGQMCPFTQVEVGGTRAATLAFTGASINEYTWTHSKCLEEYCAIWDSSNNQCSIKTISQALTKK